MGSPAGPRPADAIVVGAGPNGLAAAVTLARAGLTVHVIEGAPTPGGGCRTQELTLPGFRHDVCSAVHPLAAASPFFQRIDLAALGATLRTPKVAFAHPLDGGRAGYVAGSVEETAGGLGADGPSYRRLLGPLVRDVPLTLPELLAPMMRGVPGHPVAMARFGLDGVLPASLLARRRSRHLGVLMDVRNTFHAELVTDVDAAATGLGYDLVLSTMTPARDERRAAEILLDFRCEALILLGPDEPAGWLNALGSELPVVVVGRRVPSATVDVVRAADDRGVAQAVSHLAGLGHRDIAFVDGGCGTIAADRRRGYRQAMRRRGFASHLRVIPGDHTEEAGILAAAISGPESRIPKRCTDRFKGFPRIFKDSACFCGPGREKPSADG